MSNFPIISGIIGKKFYLILLLTLNIILLAVFRHFIPKGNDIKLINTLCGSVIQMISVLIPHIFKFKGKSATSITKCTKSIFKNYSILFLICLLVFGIEKVSDYFKFDTSYNAMWTRLCFQMIFYIILSIIILKTKYYIHNIISSILYCVFTIIIDIILGKFKSFELKAFLSIIPLLIYDFQSCYEKYLMDKKYYSYWNLLFFNGLFLFIINGIYFIIIIIIDPYDNDIFKTIREAEKRYFILNTVLFAIFRFFLRTYLTFLILENFSFNHVIIPYVLSFIIYHFIYGIITHYKNKYYLFFLIPAFFQILSLLLFLEFLEFNFCNLNKNTKRNIMLRERQEMLLINDSNKNDIESDIEIDKDLIIKNPQENNDLELCDMINNSDKKNDDNENEN